MWAPRLHSRNPESGVTKFGVHSLVGMYTQSQGLQNVEFGVQGWAHKVWNQGLQSMESGDVQVESRVRDSRMQSPEMYTQS